ncbi:MAG: glyoxylase-like metal-dependent hydrolase (beta-lactamase superfamily II) [Cellvibrionaceae bacterium]|jgi:glyoxylase-like metal-dependent hydrolase (beta-lactamase superfamily II)
MRPLSLCQSTFSTLKNVQLAEMLTSWCKQSTADKLKSMLEIHTIDLNFQGVSNVIGSYIVKGDTGLAMIETGPSSCLPTVKAELAKIGLKPSDIKHVLLTHIHFDHAGAAGWWASQGAHIYVHHVGAKHMIDPSRLVASARRVYGDAMDTLWGELLPIDPANLTQLNDGDMITVGDLEFECLDTPGHATHHMAFRLGDVCFTGDASGTRLAGRGLIDIPASPPEFDRPTWLKTVERLQSHNFREIYPTHFGLIGDPEAHLAEFAEFIPMISDFMAGLMQAGKDRDQIIEAFVVWQRQRAKSAGFSESETDQYLTASPPEVSVDGIMRYWRKKWEAESDQ